MVDLKMCRVCMAKENLTSIFSIMDGGKISEKVNFVCGIKISSSDSYPKQICHQCLSAIIIAASIKRKSLDTEKILNEMLSDEVEFVNSDQEDDDPFLVEAKSPKSRYLVYEENSEIENQPKINYNLSETSVKINSTSHFNFNPELKNFVESYLDKSPNLDIIKITDPTSIREIEKVLAINEDMKNSSAVKRQRMQKQTFAVGSPKFVPRIVPREQSSSSRLLNALSGQRFGNITVNRVSSGSVKRESSGFRK